MKSDSHRKPNESIGVSIAPSGRVDRVLQQFEAGNFASNNIIALRGSLSGSLRYRLGDWRIVFSIHREEGIVWIEAISTRGGAYRV